MEQRTEARKDEPTVQFLESLFGTTSRDLSRAMDQTTRRHGLLTENLSNVNTPGYKRRDLDFGIALDSAMGRPGQGGLGSPGLSINKGLGIEHGRPRLHASRLQGGAGSPTRDPGSVRQDGSSVDMEKEVMALAETELRYQMLTDMTASYFRGLKNVIKEGR